MVAVQDSVLFFMFRNDSSFPPNVSLERHPAAAATSTYDVISDVESGEREEEDYREERPSRQVADGYPADSSSLRPRRAEEYRGSIIAYIV